MFKVYVNNEQKEVPIDESELEMTVIDIFKAGELEKVGELCISFLDDEEMARLNKEYRGKDGPTDVLAFSQDEGMEVPRPDDPNFVPLIGDIMISAPAAVRQAEAAGHSLDREIKILLIHGILHLYGYDHNNMYQQVFMRDEEKAILTALEKMEKALERS